MEGNQGFFWKGGYFFAKADINEHGKISESLQNDTLKKLATTSQMLSKAKTTVD